MGPVEAVTSAGDKTTLQILGQAFEVRFADSVKVGDYAVAATDKVGSLVYRIGSSYVAGVSEVRIKGTVTSSGNVGVVGIGGTAVDFTPLLSSSPSLEPKVGRAFGAAGVQPLASGVVIARPGADAAVGCSLLDGRM